LTVDRRSDTPAAVSRAVVRYEGDAPLSSADRLTVEEPLEIRIAGEAVAVTMRTPGHDNELASGFLFAEGIVGSAADLGKIAHCGRPGEEGYGNVVEVQPAPGVVLDADRTLFARRGTLTNAACGVCGRRTIDDLIARCATVADAVRFSPRVISELPSILRRAQAVFAETGGLHAAAVATEDGTLILSREDVGRHNAVDKVFGRMLLDQALPATGCALVVSGRSSFEIVQKAAMARAPVVVSVSAPSSLAVDLAERVGITLVGFARGRAFTVYCHSERIV
jgi:FdhD protein